MKQNVELCNIQPILSAINVIKGVTRSLFIVADTLLLTIEHYHMSEKTFSESKIFQFVINLVVCREINFCLKICTVNGTVIILSKKSAKRPHPLFVISYIWRSRKRTEIQALKFHTSRQNADKFMQCVRLASLEINFN